MRPCWLAQTCSNCTVRRFLNRNDFGFYHRRRKGQLTPEDLYKQLPNDFWETEISFYLDKTNPCKSAQTIRTRIWRKKEKGLKMK